MVKIALTENQRDVMEKIVAFTGYTTKENIAKYKNITAHSAYELLATLEKQGYLRSLAYFTDSNKPYIYQVKLKACKELGRGDPYMRKNHSIPAVHKYLIYSHFCYNILAKKEYPFEAIINNTSERVKYLQQLGYDKDIPKKGNMNKLTGAKEWVYQVEEFLLTSPPFALPGGFGIAYAHKPWQPPLGQLNSLFSKYNGIIKASSFPVVITIISENKESLLDYVSTYEKKYKNLYKNQVKLIGYPINYNYAT